MRGATHEIGHIYIGHLISIHAPHAGRDIYQVIYSGAKKISIHAPHAGRDDREAKRRKTFLIFQSTRPMRGATGAGAFIQTGPDISIHAPHAGRDAACRCSPSAPCHFNPRAPCGARPVRQDQIRTVRRFQSTRPMRGATQPSPKLKQAVNISIHAPHAGRDYAEQRGKGESRNFNPRAPCGARLMSLLHLSTSA